MIENKPRPESAMSATKTIIPQDQIGRAYEAICEIKIWWHHEEHQPIEDCRLCDLVQVALTGLDDLSDFVEHYARGMEG